jgi:aspartate aminotransferase
VIGQYIFAALGEVPHAELQQWYEQQREYYRGMLTSFTNDMHERLPGAIVSRPDAAIYSVVDLREIAGPDFDALDFVLYCARRGQVALDGRSLTLLTAPMAGFYSVPAGAPNPGRSQLRIAYVESPERMRLVPALLAELFTAYQSTAG